MTADQIKNFGPGKMAMRSEGFSGPVHGRVRFLDLGPYPSDEFVARHNRPRFASWTSQIKYSDHHEKAPPIIMDELFRENEKTEGDLPQEPAASEVRRVFLLLDVTPSPTAMRLLRDIADFPESTVTDRYTRLKINVGRGTGAKAELLQRNFIVGRSLKTRGRPRDFYTLTDAGRQQLEREA